MLALLPLALLGQVFQGSDSIEMQIPALLESMRTMIESDMRAAMRPRPAPMANPCAADIQRLHCQDSACLLRAAETLAPACAGLLLSKAEDEPQPSPMPVPSMGTRGGTFFSISRGPGGEVSRVSGPLSMFMGGPRVPPSATLALRRPPMMAPMQDSMMAPMAVLGGLMPPDLVSMLRLTLGGMDVQLSMDKEEEEEEPEGAEAQHPCAKEVSACVRETHGDDSRPAIESCLVRHMAQLSPECQCFVHHVTGGRYAASAASAAPAAATATVSVRTVPTPETVAVVGPDMVIVEPSMPRAHGAACLFILTVLFVLSFLLVRSCVTLLCCAASARRVVVVPPEHSSIATVAPLKSSEILKAVPA